MVGLLYVLQGSLVIGSANVSSSTMSEQETKLWHMRLRHLSEQGMNILSKKRVFFGKKLGALPFCEDCVYGKH